ncbi:uncharacterized protein LOC126968882 isoform X2 [Leptidea sinapis]|uniref:uncharacterized protein LOC126968882 isoform X2 n=1 Tax=Leptidea sinapis TaxID=189913 RepID=UPI0021C3992B|nr:uncharacterized protein LOC126968882 isoform X2 [Leptidea sinapis]
MSLESSLREICANLTSIRATERKKSAETLKDMLSRSAVPSLLTDNTRKKSGYSWNHLFGDINDFIIKESEKYETNKNFYAILGLSTSLLNLCVSGANKGSTYIKCDSIVVACFNIFNDNRLRKAVGDAYYTLLYKHVLNIDHYIGFMSPASWESLLDTCINLCLTNTSQLDNLTKLKLLWLVLKKSSGNCQLILPLRDSLVGLKKCLLRVEQDKKVQDYVMEITFLLLEVLSPECRKYVCEFSESILPSIFKFYEQSMDTKKKLLLFRILHVAISVHHPLGKLSSEEGSMANNWVDWNKCKLSILEIVCLEMSFVHRSTKQSAYYATQYCDSFYVVSALIYYQVFNEDMQHRIDEISENAPKRQKRSFNKLKSFKDLVEELRSQHEPIVGIIYVYLKHFDGSVSTTDYVELIKVAELLIQNQNSNINWNEFSGMVCLAIECLTKRRYDTQSDEHLIALWNACVSFPPHIIVW